MATEIIVVASKVCELFFFKHPQASDCPNMYQVIAKMVDLVNTKFSTTILVNNC